MQIERQAKYTMVSKLGLFVLYYVHVIVVFGYEVCGPGRDPYAACTDPHAICRLNITLQTHTCQCLDGYTFNNGRCRGEGQPLPRADYDSDWIFATDCNEPPFCNFYHGFNETPAIVEVLVDDHSHVHRALGFRPDHGNAFPEVPNFIVYIYDEKYINVSTTIPFGGGQYVSRTSYVYHGYGDNSNIYYSWVRARAWKLSSLPAPDFTVSDKTMRANTSRSVDSFYEVTHNLGDYPGLVVVRAKMVHNETTFYADGVGSALNVYYNDTTRTNAYLVYGYNNESFRVWVDSSINGAIFDGRKYTRFDWYVDKAIVEILAWKLSTIAPYLTRRVSLDVDKFQNELEFPIKFRISEGLTIAYSEIINSSYSNNGYRFPTSSYMAERDYYYPEGNTDCILGGARFSYFKIPSYFLILTDTTRMNRWFMNIPKQTFNYAGLLCIPKSFGNGMKTDNVNNGTLVVYSWLDDCDPPTSEHASFDTSVNGTEVGEYVKKICKPGYTSTKPLARCSADFEWYDSGCWPVECGDYPKPANGTYTDNGTVFESVVTYNCNEGFQLIGSPQITCLADSTWSANDTRCVEIPDTTTTTIKPSGDTSNGALLSTSILLCCIPMLLAIL